MNYRASVSVRASPARASIKGYDREDAHIPTCPATAVIDAKLLSMMVENWNITSPPNAEMLRPV